VAARRNRHGFANDLQRFRCCDCGRTFNDLTGTPLARLRHKAKWLAYWLRGFRGVASRYLANYLGWRWALDGERVRSPEQLLHIAIRVINT
jgi:hypothetical protein